MSGRLVCGVSRTWRCAASLALAIAFVAVSRWFFRYAVSSYTSAGG